MSGRIAVLSPVQVVASGDMSGTIISTKINIQYMNHVWAQMQWTGSPAGSFYLDASDTGNDNDWVLGIASTALSSSPTGLDAAPISAHWVRIRYVPSGGTGTLTARISAKRI